MPGLLVSVLAFVVFAWTAAPSVGWLDSPEFVAAASSLGIPHSPGHPVDVMISRAAQLVPVGDAGFRVTLVSAAAVAATAGLVYRIIRSLSLRIEGSAWRAPHDVIAAGAAVLFALSAGAWTQAVRPEVYGLEIFLCTLALSMLTAAPRLPVAAALALGLGLANHHYITLVFALPLAAYALTLPEVRARLLPSLGAAVLGLAAYAYLPWRALRDPLVNWGNPDTPGRFWWTVSAKAFQKAVHAGQHASESRGNDILEALGTVVVQVSPAAFALGLLGLYVLLRVRGARAIGLVLVGTCLLTAILRGALGFDFDNPDALGYLLPAVVTFLVAAAVGLCLLAARAPRAGSVIAALVACLAIVQGVTSASAASRRDDYSGAEWSAALLDRVPARAVVVSSYFETIFQLWAARAVEGARPDVALYDLGMATYPGYAGSAQVRALGFGPGSGRPRMGIPLTPADFAPLARPVLIEPYLDLGPDLTRHLDVNGLFATLTPARATSHASQDFDRLARLQRTLFASGGDSNPDVRRSLLWRQYVHAAFYCAVDPPGAQAALATLTAAIPGDETLRQLMASCGRPTAP